MISSPAGKYSPTLTHLLTCLQVTQNALNMWRATICQCWLWVVVVTPFATWLAVGPTRLPRPWASRWPMNYPTTTTLSITAPISSCTYPRRTWPIKIHPTTWTRSSVDCLRTFACCPMHPESKCTVHTLAPTLAPTHVPLRPLNHSCFVCNSTGYILLKWSQTVHLC